MSDVKFVPLYDNVLITKEDGEKISKGGIFIPDDTVSKSYSEGTVVKVGNGFKLSDGGLRELKVKPGDEIIFRKLTEISIELNGVEYFVVSEQNIIGVK